jgi:hypothetical protein
MSGEFKKNDADKTDHFLLFFASFLPAYCYSLLKNTFISRSFVTCLHVCSSSRFLIDLRVMRLEGLEDCMVPPAKVTHV